MYDVIAFENLGRFRPSTNVNEKPAFSENSILGNVFGVFVWTESQNGGKVSVFKTFEYVSVDRASVRY